jgi:hypothetical protein
MVADVIAEFSMALTWLGRVTALTGDNPGHAGG